MNPYIPSTIPANFGTQYPYLLLTLLNTYASPSRDIPKVSSDFPEPERVALSFEQVNKQSILALKWAQNKKTYK